MIFCYDNCNERTNPSVCNKLSACQKQASCMCSGLRLKCDGTRAETRFRLSAKRTSPFKSARASVQSTTGSRGVRISGNNGNNAGYTMFRGSVKGNVYPLHLTVSPSLPLPCVTVCHHISTGLYDLVHQGLVPSVPAQYEHQYRPSDRLVSKRVSSRKCGA